MAESNLFELVPTLAFDPPEKKKNAEKKAAKYLEEIEKRLQVESDSAERKKLENTKAELKGLILTDEKLEKDASEIKKKAIASLEATIAMTVGRETREITTGQINAYRKQMRLAKETIEEVFKNKAFAIVETNKGKLPLLISDLTMRQINNDINTLKTDTRGEEEDRKNRTKTEDLFWVAAYVNGDISNGKTYASKTREELWKILDNNKNSFSTRIDDLGHALLNLCSIGVTQVFDSDDHLKSYRNSLRFAQLEETFGLIKNVSESTRKTAKFAESAITRIQKYFPDYGESLAIYNKAAALQDDPYEPEQISLTVSCGSCGVMLKFSSIGEAKKAKCSACGAALYRPCPKCGELVPSSAEYCPRESCGFFIAGVKNFNRYYDEALADLERFDITEAQKNFGRAKSANPSDPRLAALERKIKQTGVEYEKPLKEIESYIDLKKLRAANSKIAELHIKQPRLNLYSFESQVKSKLAEADRIFASAVSGPPAEKAKLCIKILNFCADYDEALSCLESIPPAPCTGLTAKPDGAEDACAVSWHPSPDEGVKYTLVRKAGGIPANIHDGLRLFDGQAFLDYQDKDIKPGRLYGYAIFAQRYGTVSKGAGCTAVLYSEISALRYETEETACSLTWELPENCIGVRVSRKEGGIPAPGENAEIISERAQRSLRDSGLVPGSRYGYRLQALYQEGAGIAGSSGVTCSILPEKRPLGVRISVKRNGDNCRFSWQPVQNGFDIRFVSLNQGIPVQEGRTYKDSEIRGFGKALVSERSGKGSVDISLRPETYFEAACFVTFANNGIASNTVSVNTFKPCELNGKPVLHDSTLCLSLKTPLPSGIKNIYYIARRKQRENEPPPWAGEENVQDMTSISTAEYLKRNEIVIPWITEAGDYYITLLTGYQTEGRIVYADPVRKRFSNTVPGKINFGIKRSLFRGFKLIVEFTASESISVLPALTLCYSETGGMINGANDKNAKVLYHVPEKQCRPGERINAAFALNNGDIKRMPKGRSFSLFATDESIADDYRIGFIEKFSGTL
jgi:hypothetical protein